MSVATKFVEAGRIGMRRLIRRGRACGLSDEQMRHDVREAMKEFMARLHAGRFPGQKSQGPVFDESFEAEYIRVFEEELAS